MQLPKRVRDDFLSLLAIDNRAIGLRNDRYLATADLQIRVMGWQPELRIDLVEPGFELGVIDRDLQRQPAVVLQKSTGRLEAFPSVVFTSDRVRVLDRAVRVERDAQVAELWRPRAIAISERDRLVVKRRCPILELFFSVVIGQTTDTHVGNIDCRINPIVIRHTEPKKRPSRANQQDGGTDDRSGAEASQAIAERKRGRLILWWRFFYGAGNRRARIKRNGRLVVQRDFPLFVPRGDRSGEPMKLDDDAGRPSRQEL